MTNCEHIKSQLDDRADGLLGQADEERVIAHLAECPSCAADWNRLCALDKGLDALGRLADRLATSDAVLGRPTKQGATARIRTFTRIGRAAIAAVIVLGTVAAVRWHLSVHPIKSVPDAILVVHTTQKPNTVENQTTGQSTFKLALAEDDGRWAVPVRTENPRFHIVWLYEPVKSMRQDSSPGADEKNSRENNS